MGFLDIIKGVNTGYYEKGILIDDRKKIIKNYKLSALPYDILAMISVIVNRVYFPNLNLTLSYAINLLFFLKFYIIIDILNKVDTTF